MTINLSVPATRSSDGSDDLKPRISVIGVGGAGGNAVNNMIQMGLEGVDFIVANSDAQALSHSQSERKIQIGTEVTKGLGAGSNPSIGRAAAEESLEEILSHLQDVNMVFVTAGLGGGTGTGAAPVIAKVARDNGVLTVGVVTKPFQFEGSNRMNTAEVGLEELQQFVDTLLIIPNQNLFRVANESTTFADAFKMADDVLYSGVRGVTDLMVMPGLINLDFADIRSVMSEMGKAMMGTGEAEGERRAVEAAEAAIANPLLDDTSMIGAKGVLINITAGKDITLFEVDEAANRIRDEVADEANIIFGSTFEESLEGRIRVSVVATGIEAVAGNLKNPIVREIDEVPEKAEMVSTAPVEPGLSVATDLSPVLFSEKTSPEQESSSLSGEENMEEQPRSEQRDLIVQIADSKSDGSDLQNDNSYENTSTSEKFIPAPAIDGISNLEHEADPFAEAAMLNAGTDNDGKKVSKKAGLSLIERVTRITLGEKKSETLENKTSAGPKIDNDPILMEPKVTEQLIDKTIVREPDDEQIPKVVDVTASKEVPERNTQILGSKESENTPETPTKVTSHGEKISTGAPESGLSTLLDREHNEQGLINDEQEEDLLEIPAFLRRQAN